MMSTDQPERCWFLKPFFKRAHQIPCRIICVAVLLLQTCLLDYFLISYNNYVWFLWVIPDVVVMSFVLASLIISYRSFPRPESGDHIAEEGGNLEVRPEIAKTGGELPLGYIAWFSYSVVISAKIIVIFGSSLYIVGNLRSDSPLDGSVLRTAVSMSSVIFFTLVITHHDAPAKSERQSFMESLSSSVAIDLLDVTQLLDVLYPYESHVMLTFGLHSAVVAIACFMLILPTILLLALSRSRMGRSDVWLKRLRFLHKVVYYLAVNVPMLVMRSVIWHIHKREASVFVMKNIIGVGIAIQEIHTKMAEVIKTPGSRSFVEQELVPMKSASADGGVETAAAGDEFKTFGSEHAAVPDSKPTQA